MQKFNSTIKIKPCKGGCGKPKKLSYNGYCSVKCMPEEEQVKDKWKNKAISNRKAANSSQNSRKVWMAQNEVLDEFGAKNELNRKIAIDRFFREQAKHMTGRCENCGGKTCKGDKQYEKFSQAHILSKSIFVSVATHPLNLVELCFWDNSCHTNFDNNGYEYVAQKMPKLWAIIVERVNKLYPFIVEKNKLPDVLLQEIKPH